MMQFIFAPILGAISDRFGRRPVLLLSCLGLGLDYILMALAPNLWWLFVGRVISGITAASFSTAAAYIADVTSPEKRAASYAMFGAAWGLGFVLGPAVGGALGEINLRWPFWLAAGLTLLNAAYGFFVLPESLAPENRRKFSGSAPIHWFAQAAAGSSRTTQPGRSHLALSTGPSSSAKCLRVLLDLSLFLERQSCWLHVDGGGHCQHLGARLFGAKSRRHVVRSRHVNVGTDLRGLRLCDLWPGTESEHLLVRHPVFALVGFFSPGIQSMMTKRVGVDQQGQLQGINSSLMGIAGMIGPTLFTSTFKQAVPWSHTIGDPMIGAPFYLAAVLHIIALGIVVGSTNATKESAQPLASGSP